MRDLTILLDLEIGRPADILTDAAAQHLPVIAGCVFPRLGGRVGHTAIRDEDVAEFTEIVRKHGGVLVDDRECVVVPADYPGGAAGASRAVADAGVMVNVAYFGTKGEIVFVTSDTDGARSALGGSS